VGVAARFHYSSHDYIVPALAGIFLGDG